MSGVITQPNGPFVFRPLRLSCRRVLYYPYVFIIRSDPIMTSQWFKHSECYVFALVIGALAMVGGPALADGSKIESLKERQHIRANIKREQSKAKAQSQLRRETFPSEDTDFNRHVDFYALGQQIKRLGDLIQKLANPAQMGPGPGGMPGLPGSGGAYGPDGPTEKTVRVVLDYRLMAAGNPRLKAGSVKDAGDRIIAQVVTVDGSLVEEYAVDKKTGVWRSVRN